MKKSANPEIASASHNTFFGQGQAAARNDSTTTLWAYLRDDRSRQLALIASGEIDCGHTAIPVWRIAAGSEESRTFHCQFVRYIDMPTEMAQAFRDQQVLAGKPFDGAAYVEDFQLFAELCQRKV